MFSVLSQWLGLALPIVQAPMAGVQDSALAVAVSNAGGLGSLPCAMLGADALRAELGDERDFGAKKRELEALSNVVEALAIERTGRYLVPV